MIYAYMYTYRYTLELDGCSAYTCIPLNIYIDDICIHAYI